MADEIKRLFARRISLEGKFIPTEDLEQPSDLILNNPVPTSALCEVIVKSFH